MVGKRTPEKQHASASETCVDDLNEDLIRRVSELESELGQASELGGLRETKKPNVGNGVIITSGNEG